MISPAQQNLTNAQLAPAQLGEAISTAVAAKTLNVARMEGAAALQLLQNAAPPQAGPGDPLVAKATGLGSLLDITA